AAKNDPHRALADSAAALSPLARFLQLANSSPDQIAFDKSEVLQKQHAIQMVGLMAEGARQQAFPVHLKRLSRGVLRPNRYVLRPRHISATTRHGKAALLLALLSLRVNDLRIGQNDFGFAIFAGGYV